MQLPDVSFSFSVDLLEQYRAVDAVAPENEPWDNRLTHRWLAAIGRLNACRETCDGHAVWAIFDLEAKTWEGMQSEVNRTLGQIYRITKRYAKETTAPPPPVETICKACLSPAPGFGRKGVPNLMDGKCPHCRVIFGSWLMQGCTNDTPDQALQCIADVKEQGFLMTLRELTLATPDGNRIHVEAGDIFQCRPSNPEREPIDIATKENTWALFTLKLKFGPYEVTLFTHEFAAISLATVMDLKNRGEIVEAFLSTDDPQGHLQPTPAMREMILANFGGMI